MRNDFQKVSDFKAFQISGFPTRMYNLNNLYFRGKKAEAQRDWVRQSTG
jgi:hypothetical protein